MSRNFNRHHGARPRSFEINDLVYYKHYLGKKWSWQPGSVVGRLGEALYSVQTTDGNRKVHANQMQRRYNAEPSQLYEQASSGDDITPASD